MTTRGSAIDRDEAVERVREATDIVALVGERVTLRRSGANLVGLCPLHQERTPSFTVNPTRQVFHCFGCGVGGDVFTFVRQLEGLTFPEALTRLADRAGIALPATRGEGGERSRLGALLERATNMYEKALAHERIGAEARAYLEGRGIQADAIARFRIGYAPDAWDTITGRVPGEQDRLVSVGLAVRGEHGRVYDRFRNRIVFPVMDATGRVIGHGARALGDGQGAKYLNSPETPLYRKGRVLYGPPHTLAAIREAGEAIIVEGYTDLLSLYQVGVRNVVASCGTAFTPMHAEVLHRLAGSVVLMYDADDAGRAASRRTAAMLLGRGFTVRVVEMPAGADPDSFAREAGGEAVTAAIAQARPALEWIARPAGAEHEAAAVRSERVVAFLAQVDDDLRRRSLAQDAAALIGVPVDVATDAVERARPLSGTHAPSPAAAPARQPAPAARASPREEALAQRKERLLALVLAYPDLRGDVSALVRAEDFESPVRRALAEHVLSDAPVTDDDVSSVRARLAIEGAEVALDQARGEARAHALAVRTLVTRRAYESVVRDIERRLSTGGASADVGALRERQRQLQEELRELTHD